MGRVYGLTLDIGEDNTRNVFAGIKAHYKPEELEGKLTAAESEYYDRVERHVYQQTVFSLS